MSPTKLIYYRAFGGKLGAQATISNTATGAHLIPEFHRICLIAG